jgi:CTP synthase
VVPIHAEELDNADLSLEKLLGKLDGVLVAPGFGERGISGKIKAIEYVRKNNIPFFGICLGMQCAVVEFALHVAAIESASSTEVNPETSEPVIDMMEEQKKITAKGGTMRLGAYACELKKKTKAALAYGSLKISERHRHRYEFNNAYLEKLTAAGLIVSGVNPQSGLVEIVELADHPWFVGVQFHPELKSTVENPHPLFVHFVKASLAYKRGKI